MGGIVDRNLGNLAVNLLHTHSCACMLLLTAWTMQSLDNLRELCMSLFHCALDSVLSFTASLRPWNDVLDMRFCSIPSREECTDRVPLNFSTFGYNYVFLAFILVAPGMLGSFTFALTFLFCGSLWYLYSLHVEPQVTPIQAYAVLMGGSTALIYIICGPCLGFWCTVLAASIISLHAILHEHGSYQALPPDSSQDAV